MKPQVVDARFGQRIEDAALYASRAAFVAAAAALPIATAGATVSIGLGVIFWIASGRVAEAWRIVRTEPVAAVAMCLLALMCLSALWSPAPVEQQWVAIGKFRKLLLIPIVASLFDDQRWRMRVLIAAAVAGGLTLVLSYFSGLTGYQFPVALAYPVSGGVAPLNATVFKQHVTQGWLMSLFAFGCLSAAACTRDRRRWLWGAAGVLAIIDNLAFVQGRTGHVGTVALVFLWSILLLGRRGVLLAALATAIGAAIFAVAGGAFVARIHQTATEFEALEHGSTNSTSVAYRMTFYRNSAILVGQSPIIGHGLGSMSTVYAPLTVGKKGVESEIAGNPHNEYLNTAIQAGLGATLLYVAALVLLFRRARAVPGLAGWLGQGLAVLVLVSSLFNSTLWDFNEGNVFVLFTGWIIASARAVNRT